jgi:endonuclease/exonuclease/phosphatase family metal-dependent hydrolase
VHGAEHVEAIRQRTAASFPTAIVLEPKQELVPGSCDAQSLEPLKACVAAACTDPPAADCILDNCSPEFDAQPGDCGVCLATNLGKTIDEISTVCTTEAPRYPYDGSYGLMLLSRIPVVAQDHIELTASITRRAVIHATLENDVSVFCTHFTAMERAPYPIEGGSWDAEQQAQADALIDYVATADSQTTLVLGDLNLGPGGDTHQAEQPDRYAAIAGGFTGAFGGSCTFCSDNLLVADGKPSVLIDHVLVRGAEVTGERILDAPITIASGTTHLSDHYGVRATVTR